MKSFLTYFDIVALQELKSAFQETKLEVKHIQSQWNEEVERLGENFILSCFSFPYSVALFEICLKSYISFIFPEHHLKGLEMASSSYHKVLEENRILYNQVQDLKGNNYLLLSFSDRTIKQWIL